MLKKSNDGSHTVISEKYDETYHSIHGAITESAIVFIKGGLDYLLSRESEVISVFELGFGTGLNAFLACIWAKVNGIRVFYHTVESEPLPIPVTDEINYPEFLGHADIFYSLHHSPWNIKSEINDHFSFIKEDVCVENSQPNTTFDVIFFDAFSPKSQPELWDIDILSKMYSLLNPGGVLVTYCAQGAFKRNLKKTGFMVEKIPGPPFKREITRAIKL
jgi:tRNA U34 5-methylaminomethyl-2-thiouridine-forming methyltransferase MnmC